MENTSLAAERYRPERLAVYVPTSAVRVLDCSCGDGARARAIKARSGAWITGTLEAAGGACDGGCEGCDEVLPGPVEEVLGTGNAPFDCIICDDVLASRRDPLPVLTCLVERLAPAGLMVLTFPNVQYHQTFAMLAMGRWEYADTGAMARSHLRFFTATEIPRLLRHAGLRRAVLHGLVQDPASAFPRDGDGCVRRDRLTLGPLSEEEHKRFLIQQYLVLAQKAAE